MDISWILGTSNVSVLIAAAAIGVGAVVIFLTLRALFAPGRQHIAASKIDRLEVRLASLGDGETVSTASELLSGDLRAPDAAVLEDLFTAAAIPTGIFSSRPNPRRVAEAAAMEISDSMDTVHKIGRIVLNAYEGGSLEVASHRRGIMREIRELAGNLGSATWKKQATRLMVGEMPDQATSLVGVIFAQTHELKLAIADLPKDPGVDGLIVVLDRSIGIAKANERTRGLLNVDAA